MFKKHLSLLLASLMVVSLSTCETIVTLADETIKVHDTTEASSVPGFKMLRYQGLKYFNGDGVEQDYAMAAQLFEQAAEAGDISAAYYLAVMYEQGLGVQQDEAQAIKWYYTAISQVDEYRNNTQNSGPDELKQALCALASIALNCGNTDAAITYYQYAADLGWEEAFTQLQALEAAGITSTATTATQSTGLNLGVVDDTLASDEDALIATYADKFEQKTYTDTQTGLSITYNLYLPDGYDATKSYPMVVFIGDSSCAGNDATVSLTQGRGGLVWATSEWQSVYPTIVAVPTYPETILDDHGSYTTTEYVELTKRYIDYMTAQYAVDTDRIYGTGQSMGCMTTLILASEYPDLYAACMFVDGQWDVSTLSGLANQKFVYFAAEDDTNAWNGAQEVMAMFDTTGTTYKYAQWDGTWSVDQLSSAASALFTTGEDQYFISWKTGTIEPKTTGNGGMGGFGGGMSLRSSGDTSISSAGFGDSGSSGSNDSATDSASTSSTGFGSFGGSGSTSTASDSASTSSAGNKSAGMNSSSYHMASFDYAYNCVAAMEWLFQQSK